MKIKVLYEDDDILVIDKPSGISVHGDGKTSEYTVSDWVLENYPNMKGVGEPLVDIERPGIVHRLDKGTSGVLILAKNQKAHTFFKEQFKNRELKKVYHCIVNGFVKKDFGVVNKPIGRSPSDFRKRSASRGAKGEMREAVTNYKVLRRFEDEQHNKFTYLEVRPQTGRTHQIRVHMKFLSHPLVGDNLYNPNQPSISGLERLALHARSIEFKKMNGETVKIESPLPGIFDKYLNR